MKRRAIAWLTVGALIGALVIAALPAGAGPNDKIKKLTKKVNALEAQVDDLNLVVGDLLYCFSLVVPMSSFGDWETNGYVYRVDQDEFLVSALDVDPESPEPHFFASAVQADCVQPVGSPTERRRGGRLDLKVHEVQRGG